MTTKQDEARQNNWHILQLRGCWEIISKLPVSKLNRQFALWAIDEILKELGAETELVHRQTRRKAASKKKNGIKKILPLASR